MKTIEELGEIARETYLLSRATEGQRWVEVAKAVVADLITDGVSWAPEEAEEATLRSQGALGTLGP